MPKHRSPQTSVAGAGKQGRNRMLRHVSKAAK